MTETGTASRASILKAGDIIANGKYEIVRQLGEGAMGFVYICKRKDLDDRMCAIKVLRPEISSDPVVAARFRDEVITALDVSHKNVVRAYDYFNDRELIAYSMEFVDGGDLSDLMSRVEKFTITEVINFTRQIIEGVQALHNSGIIHRDLKPENVLLTKSQEVKISDFGIAIIEKNQRRTQTGGLLGTASYLSPEYLTGNQIDRRSDIYAIGIIAYELLLKRHPFEADSIYDTVQNQMAANFARPRHIRAECPIELEEFVVKALRSNPEDRYQNCSEMLKDLEVALNMHLRGEVKRDVTDSDPVTLEFEEDFNSHKHAPLTGGSPDRLISNSVFSSGVEPREKLKTSELSRSVKLRKQKSEYLKIIYVGVIIAVIAAGIYFYSQSLDTNTTLQPEQTVEPTKVSEPKEISGKFIKEGKGKEAIAAMEITALKDKIKSFSAQIKPTIKDNSGSDILINSITIKSDNIIDEGGGTFTALAETDVSYIHAGETKTLKATSKLAMILFKDTGLLTINYYSPVNLKLESVSKEIYLNVKDGAPVFYVVGRHSVELKK